MPSPSISSPPIRWSILTHAAEKLTSRCVAVHVVCKADQAAYRSTFTMIWALAASGIVRFSTASHYSPEGIPPRALLLRQDLPHHVLDLGETRALAELS